MSFGLLQFIKAIALGRSVQLQLGSEYGATSLGWNTTFKQVDLVWGLLMLGPFIKGILDLGERDSAQKNRWRNYIQVVTIVTTCHKRIWMRCDQSTFLLSHVAPFAIDHSVNNVITTHSRSDKLAIVQYVPYPADLSRLLGNLGRLSFSSLVILLSA